MNAFHNRYLDERVRVGIRSRAFQDGGPNCPETFRVGSSTREYGGTGSEIMLVRLEDARFIAASAMWDNDTARELLTTVADANRQNKVLSRADQSAAASLLDGWQDRVDARPIFAAFWEDAAEVDDWSSSQWANLARDKMGLAHYDATLRGSIDVVLFKYQVGMVPAGHSGAKMIVRPTVLDSPLSEAFYTGEPGSGVGSTVDLVVRDDSPWQEVLHPPFTLRPRHVWATGTIDTGVPSSLASARQHHMLKVATSAGDEFAILCENVDGDL